jgi:hypothetical protein
MSLQSLAIVLLYILSEDSTIYWDSCAFFATDAWLVAFWPASHSKDLVSCPCPSLGAAWSDEPVLSPECKPLFEVGREIPEVELLASPDMRSWS